MKSVSNTCLSEEILSILCRIEGGMTSLRFHYFPHTGKPFRGLFLFVLSIVILFSNIISVDSVQARPKIGLVLGGGAARGFSHIGLIQALEEAGIPIDIIVGTSMGSIVGGLYAAGYSTSNLAQIAANLDPAQLFDLQYMVAGGIISSAKFELFVRELFDNKEFSQLKIPFCAVVTDLRTGEEVVLNSGQVSKAIQASSAIPGLFSPVLIGERYLVDGGLKNAVPVNVARDNGADVVIAVDVKKDLKEINYDNILHNIQLTMWFMIDGYVEQHIVAAEVIIVPDVQYDSYMEFDRSSYFIQEGYKAGKARIEDIRAAILAVDSGFAPTPYRSQGYSEKLLASWLSRARQSVLAESSGVRPFVSGELGLGISPDVGLVYSSARGHKVSAYLNGNNSLARLSIGVRAESAEIQGRSLWLSCAVKNPVEWRLGVKDEKLFEGRSWQMGSAVSLGKSESGMLWKLSSEVKWFIKERPMPLYEVFESYPYVTLGVLVGGGMSDALSSVEYTVGIGNRMRLFGLYPTDLRIVLHYDESGYGTWRLGLQAGVDALH